MTSRATPNAGNIDRPALGILELSSIARGVVVSDAAVKQAPALLLASRPVSSGKHLVMMRGGVAEVQEAMAAARRAADARLIDSLELPMAHDGIWPVLVAAAAGPVLSADWSRDGEAESVAIVETETVCAAIEAADAALKAAAVALRDVRLAVGIAGRAFFTMTGPLADIEAASEAAERAAGHRAIAIERIAQPADELRGRLIF